MAKRSKKDNHRLNDEVVQPILIELDAWLKGDRRGRLTWEYLARHTGFSRQALCANSNIAAVYRQIKNAQRPSQNRKPPRTTDERIAALQATVDHLRRVITQYDERWSRIAWHAGVRNIDLEELQKPLPDLARQRPRVARNARRRM